jgi:hypothetical protein
LQGACIDPPLRGARMASEATHAVIPQKPLVEIRYTRTWFPVSPIEAEHPEEGALVDFHLEELYLMGGNPFPGLQVA